MFKHFPKIQLLTLVVALISATSFANPVSQEKAKEVALKFIQNNTSLKSSEATLAYTFESLNDNPYLFIFNVADKGFVVVSADDLIGPIVGYSTEGIFSSDDISPEFAYYMNCFTEKIEYLRSVNAKPSQKAVDQWNQIMATGSLTAEKQTTFVNPLVKTKWNQGSYYNNQCPKDARGPSGRVYAGCVATAMGQVMKFWDYPTRGTGSYTYYPDGYPQQTANFGETDYHFELMPLAIDSTSTEEEIFYIAQFLHHCGIAVDMQYGNDGSGAYSDDVPPALRSYFGYTCDDHLTNYGGWWPGYGYDNEEWAQMLKDGGLDENLPLYYSGSDDGGAGGHAFVCDGYDENDYFHFNWGWSGRDDAWCPIGALNTTKYAFNTFNGFTGHIIPVSADYYQRADSVSNFSVHLNATMDGVSLNWINPSTDLNGDILTDIESITIRRNNEVIAVLTDVEVGDYMGYSDEGLEPGLYKYAIYVTNAYGISRNVYRSILVGEMCKIFFELHDVGGDGWKGASISVTDENGQRIAVITMTEGSELLLQEFLLRQNLNFIWNHGWYHTSEQYDTDYECSFTIYDGEGNELYTSDDLEDGVFMSYNNDCETTPHVAVIEHKEDTRVYPNPTSGLINIEGRGEMTITVTNILGQKLIETVAEGSTSVDLSRFGQGVYMLNIETINGTTIQKLSVTK